MRQSNTWTVRGLAATGAAVVVGLAMIGGCESKTTPTAGKPPASEAKAPALKTPSIAFDLPDKYNTPDGMTVDKAGNIILSVNNYNDPNFPAVMLRISPDDKLSEIITLPKNGDTGKSVCPLGVAVGSDGNLYIADNQAFTTDEHKSRLMRITMKDGKGVKCEPVVTGLVMANGVAARGDRIYVCDSKLDGKASPLPSGVYGFKIADLDPAKPIAVKPGTDDPHLAIKFFTKNKEWAVGANGLGFGSAGDMFVCNFGDAELIQAKIGPDGKAVSQKVVAAGSGMLCCDGLSIDRKTGEVYIADFLGNAVHKVDPKTGKVTTIAKNDNTDGAGGALDRPSEPCVRGNRVYVANIDLPLAGNKYDKPHTVSVIELGK